MKRGRLIKIERMKEDDGLKSYCVHTSATAEKECEKRVSAGAREIIV